MPPPGNYRDSGHSASCAQRLRTRLEFPLPPQAWNRLRGWGQTVFLLKDIAASGLTLLFANVKT
jgi:hypothetical protein